MRSKIGEVRPGGDSPRCHRSGSEMSEEEYGVVHAGMGRTFLRNVPSDPSFASKFTRLWDAAGLQTSVVSEEEIMVLQWK